MTKLNKLLNNFQIRNNFANVQKGPLSNPDYDHVSTYCGGCMRATEILSQQKVHLFTLKIIVHCQINKISYLAY